MRRSLLTLLLLMLAAAGVLEPASGHTVTPTAQRADDNRLQDERTAVRVVDGFWRSYFGRTGQTYHSPRVVGGYVGADGPSCGGEPAVSGNAFYCSPGDFIAWDEQLMAAGYRQLGDAWVYLVIAHEWGHAIQARLVRSQVSVAAELQADCLAGAALQGAVDQGTIRLETGDAEKLRRGLVAVADSYPWTDSSSHGDAQERTSAFRRGAQGGVGACV